MCSGTAASNNPEACRTTESLRRLFPGFQAAHRALAASFTVTSVFRKEMSSKGSLSAASAQRRLHIDGVAISGDVKEMIEYQMLEVGRLLLSAGAPLYVQLRWGGGG